MRELLDNAIDAGASNISVHLSNGGKSYIEVRDDGRGMDKDDLVACTKNHTTSKIKAFDDINSLLTLGFRGEALSSIAEVSRLTIQSRQKDALSGNKLEVDSGKILSIKETGMNTGTSVIAEGLFQNMPAREKFLSGAAAETKLIDREIVKKALAYPGIGFELYTDGKKKYASSVRNTNLERIADFFPDAIDSLLTVESISENSTLYGFASKSVFIRPNRSYQFFFVNGRAVEWKNFFFAVNNAYGNLVPKGHFPAVFLYLEISPEFVDVNVHPMKREVRFRDEQKIMRFLQEAVHRTVISDIGITEADVVPQGFTPYERKIGQAIGSFMLNRAPDYEQKHLFQNNLGALRQHFDGLSTAAQDDRRDSGGLDFQGSRSRQEESPFQSPSEAEKILPKEKKLTDFRFVGIIFKTYILLEDDEALLFIDQHAFLAFPV